MELTQLRTFVAVAQEGHLTRAAERLHISQPAASAHIRALESSFEVQLFVRTNRGLELTEAGRDFHEQIKGSLEQLEKAYAFAKSAGKSEHGRVRLATLPSLAAGEARSPPPMAPAGRTSSLIVIARPIASDAASYISGVVLPVDGGIGMGI